MDLCGLGKRCKRHGIQVGCIGRAPVKCDMRASGIEEVEVASKAAARLADGVIVVQVHLFIVDRASQLFDEDVVAPAVATVHADAHLVDLQSSNELGTRELRTLIRVKTLRTAKAVQCLPQDIDSEVRCEDFRALPGEDFADEPIDEGNEVHEAANHRDVSHVRRSDLIRSIEGDAAQQVRDDGILETRPTCVPAAVNRLDSHAAHERRDVPSANLPALAPEQVARRPGTGDRQLQVQFTDSAHRAQVQIRCRHLAVVHARAQQAQKLGLSADRKPMHAIHHRFPLGPSSLPSSVPKNSISRASWLILACSSLRFGPSCFGGFSGEKGSSAPASSWDFHWAIWFGRTSKRPANSTSVASPLRVASTAIDLKTGESLRRDLWVISAPSSRRYLRLPEQSNPLIQLPRSTGAISVARFV